jgi:hypothetical protein
MPLKSFDFLYDIHQAATSRSLSILSWRNPLTLSIPPDSPGPGAEPCGRPSRPMARICNGIRTWLAAGWEELQSFC